MHRRSSIWNFAISLACVAVVLAPERGSPQTLDACVDYVEAKPGSRVFLVNRCDQDLTVRYCCLGDDLFGCEGGRQRYKGGHQWMQATPPGAEPERYAFGCDPRKDGWFRVACPVTDGNFGETTGPYNWDGTYPDSGTSCLDDRATAGLNDDGQVPKAGPSEAGPGTVAAQTAPSPVSPQAEPDPDGVSTLQLLLQNVRQLQQLLAAKGFDPGPLDGILGGQTRAAIGAWQEARGFSPTGDLGPDQALRLVTEGDLQPRPDPTETAAEAPATPSPETAVEVLNDERVTTPPQASGSASDRTPICLAPDGSSVGEQHAACWWETTNQPGCFLWTDHFASDRVVNWDGGCRDGVLGGNGTLSETGGSDRGTIRATGSFKGGRKVGHWVERAEYSEGDTAVVVQEGPYVDGEQQGDWVQRTEYRNGSVRVIEGPVVGGRLHGRWVERVEFSEGGGRVEEGPYVENSRHGQWVERFEFSDGVLRVREGPYVEGDRNGLWAERHEWPGGDVSVGEGPYVEGEKHGRWVSRFEGSDGDVFVTEGSYVNGKEHGRWVRRPEGTMRGYVELFEGPYVEGSRHGHWVEHTHWPEDKVWVEEGPYVEGKRHGEWVERTDWHDGRVWVEEGPYIEGKRHGEWVSRRESNEGDVRVSEDTYVDGELHSQ